MAHLKLLVLGQPRLERDGEPVELNLRKALALLVYLAVSGQSYSRDALATMLWPESDGREGRARLRRTLHRLNEAIGDGVLDSGPEAIRLHPIADLWLDRVSPTAAPRGVIASMRASCSALSRTAAGFSPRIVQAAAHAPTILGLVAAGLGVSVLADS